MNEVGCICFWNMYEHLTLFTLDNQVPTRISSSLAGPWTIQKRVGEGSHPRHATEGFTVKHYAGLVEYNTKGWLDKTPVSSIVWAAWLFSRIIVTVSSRKPMI